MNRGVVAAASYESRVFGIRSAMPMVEARRRCPDLRRVVPRMSHYQDVSRQIFTVFREFSPLVEGLSLDEAFLDVTSSRKLFGSGRDIAHAIKTRIHEQTELTASVGVAENKLVARIASDLDKPDGLVVITSDDVHARLDPLPVQVIPGIGKETLARLHRIDVRTIADLRHAPNRDLEPVFGRFTQKTLDRAAGIDNRPVIPARDEKSISAEETYDEDLSDRHEMERQLLRLTERTSSRLRKAGLAAGTVQVKIRQADFQTFTRQKGLHPAGNGTDEIFELARALLRAWLADNPDARVRLLGVGGTNLAPAGQGDLFAGQESAPGTDVDRTVDEIRDRFGGASVSRARTLD
jgi:DNA polymerase-4